MINSDPLASVLVDQAIVTMLMPWPCPSSFGPEERFCLEELIGAGPNSLIYRATDTRLSSTGFPATVAIKITRERHDVGSEALTARRINHPNVLRVLDRGSQDGEYEYTVLEYVTGGDLQGVKGPWESRGAAAFMAKVARAVHAAHSAGVVHCDLKPANILLTGDGEPKLADFDLAQTSDESDRRRGNLAFMSPEQFEGLPEGLTPPSDVYALGGMLYHLLTGRMPHGETPEQVRETHRLGNSVPPPGVGHDLDRICARALARDRDQRYESAAALAGDLERWLNHEPLTWGRTSIGRRLVMSCRRQPVRAGLLVAAAAILAGAVVVSVVMIRSAEREHRTKLEAQAESNRLAKEQVEKAYARVRAHIRSFASMITRPHEGDLQDRVLPTLVWLQWIADIPVFDTNGEAELAVARCEALQHIIEKAEGKGQGNNLEARLARYALGHFQLLNGDSGPALVTIRRATEDWSALLDPADPLMRSLDAMKTCAGADLDVDRPKAEVLAELAQLEASLARSGDAEPTRRLVVWVRARLAKR
jgi:hypothetical protein